MQDYDSKKIKYTSFVAAGIFLALAALFAFGRNAIETFNLQCLALSGEIKIVPPEEQKKQELKLEIKEQRDKFKKAKQLVKTPVKKKSGSKASTPVVKAVKRSRPAENGYYATLDNLSSVLPTIAVNEKKNIVQHPENWRGPDDLSFKCRVTRRSDGFQVVVVVMDDVRWAKNPKVQHMNDCVEIYFDVRPKGERGKTAYVADSVRHALIVPSYGSRENANTMIFHYKSDEKMPKDCRIASKVIPGGYRVEAFFPFSMFKTEIGDEINFDIGVIDYDGERNYTQMVWSGTQDNYKDTSLFGRLKPAKK